MNVECLGNLFERFRLHALHKSGCNVLEHLMSHFDTEGGIRFVDNKFPHLRNPVPIASAAFLLEALELSSASVVIRKSRHQQYG